MGDLLALSQGAVGVRLAASPLVFFVLPGYCLTTRG